MIIPSNLRRILLSIGALVLTGTALVAVPATGAGAAANSAAGIGTDAAKNSPLCDPTTGRIKIPAYLASVCVKPWKEGADNGGATYQGVTKDSVKVVVYVPPIELQKNPPGGQPPTNRSTGKPGTIQDAVLDAQQALDGRYQLWGRKIEYEFFTYSGTDEAAQRAGRSDGRREEAVRGGRQRGRHRVLRRDRQAQDRDGLRLHGEPSCEPCPAAVPVHRSRRRPAGEEHRRVAR